MPMSPSVHSVRQRFQTFKPLKPLCLSNNFHMDTPFDAATEICSNDPCHMTKMAAQPIYGKTLLRNLLLQNPIGTWYVALGI